MNADSIKTRCIWFGFAPRLAFYVVAVNVLLCAVVGWALFQSRLHYVERAQTNALNISRLLEQNLSDLIERIELHLHIVSDEVQQRQAGRQTGSKSLDEYLRALHAHSPEVGSLRIVNADGIITHGSGKTLVREADVSDREYFRFLRDNPAHGTYLSKPVIGRTSGEWILVFSRRINNDDGSFAGVVNGTIELSRFDWLFSVVDVGGKGLVSLRGEDFGVIARNPRVGNAVEMAHAKVISSHLKSFIVSGKQYGVMMTVSPFDGIERITSVRKIGNYPLYLIVGIARDDYLAKWWREMTLAVIGMTAFLLMSAWLARMLGHNWTQRQALIDELNMSRDKYHALAELSAEWFWEQDENFRFVNVSTAMARKYARTPEELNGKARWEVGGGKSEEEWRDHRAALEAHQQFQNFEYFLQHDDGSWRCLSVSGEPVFDAGGRFIGYRGVGSDITEKKQYEERIAHMAQFDALTDLPNRALFHDRLLQAISIAKREQREFALLYFDLDRFKSINDRYGHGAGDQLLRLVAERIRMQLRESDTVARVGGDEFAVLLPAIVSSADAEEVARRIVESLTSNFQLDSVDAKISVGVSIGIAIFPRNGTVLDELFKAADEAMYVSKKSGNQYSFA